MTEKIYHRDAYCRELTSPVTGKESCQGRWRLRLERTIFRPEGGGQPADGGTINGLPLLALEEDGDDIVHVVGNDPGGGDVALRLDFERRFDHMQQHTAQHLLSQVLVRCCGAATLSFAIGPEHSSIETDRPCFSEEETRTVENECMRRIFAALPVRVFASDDPSVLHLRKPAKIAGQIRVVEIAGLDQSACGGTHVGNSAEIGVLKIVRTERVRANVRLVYAAGWRALRDHQLKHDVAQQLQRLVTQPLAEIPGHVKALLRERDGLRREVKKALRREMEREVAAAVAAGDSLVVREFSGLDPSDLRFFATSLMKHGRHVLAFQRPPPALEPSGGGAYIVVGRGQGGFDLRGICARLFAILNGKGGGSANLIEGRGRDFSRSAEAIGLLREALNPGP
ncbi:MAG: DHHA1 domain-containing protein [Acidobacteria bacterium]|jgi:alanyl-tRNA synthetase|nr:DHHA1 domain-containing protein [Acidobacteriota bacterium]